MSRMTAADAQSYWISRRVPSDEYLLYCFDGCTESPERIAADLLERAAMIDDLRIRVGEVPAGLDAPHWVPMDPHASRVVRRPEVTTWAGCLDAVSEILLDQVDPIECPWRIHLFGPVSGAPECGGGAVVVVLQIAHALADGRRAASLARELLARQMPSGAATPRPWRPRRAALLAVARYPLQIGRMLLRARPAHRTHRQRERDTAAGLIAPQPLNRPTRRTNIAPGPRRSLITVVLPTDALRAPGISVTVGALTVISLALDTYLSELGDTADAGLAAEVTVAKSGKRRSRNHFRNVAVDLHPDIEGALERAAAIADSLRQARRRADHPAAAAADRALETIPAPLLRRGIENFDFTVTPAEVTGHTVVSSVDRGPADLVLGGGTAVFTAGFPALSHFMGLTHGVHGLGDRITLSVATSPAVTPDPRRYEQLLRRAVDEYASATRRTANLADGTGRRYGGPVGADTGPATPHMEGTPTCRP